MSGISPVRSHFVGLDSPTHKKWVTAIGEFYAASKIAQKCLQEMKEGKSVLSYDLDSHSFTKNQFLDPSVLYYENNRLIDEGEKYYIKQWRDDQLSLLIQKVPLADNTKGVLLQFLKNKASRADTDPLPIPQALDKFLLKLLENRIKPLEDKKTNQHQKVVTANNTFKEKEAQFLQSIADFEKNELYKETINLQLAWEQALLLQPENNISKLIVNYFADLLQKIHAQAKPAANIRDSALLSLFSDIRFHPQIFSKFLLEVGPSAPAEMRQFIRLLAKFIKLMQPFEQAFIQARFSRYMAQKKEAELQGKTAPEKPQTRPLSTQELLDALEIASRPVAPSAPQRAQNQERHFWGLIGSVFAKLFDVSLKFFVWLFQLFK